MTDEIPPNLPPTTLVIVLAAGRGTRAGGKVPKQWRPLLGRPVLAHTLECFAAFPRMVVIDPADAARAHRLLSPEQAGLHLVHGGASRTASVRAALEAAARLARPISHVLIHDGARPLVSARLIADLMAALERSPAAAPALAVTDALWRGAGGRVTGTLAREGLFRAQTPQAFRFDALLAAYRDFRGDAADDVAVARAAGLDVAITEGEEDNIKLTWPGDFARAEALIAKRNGEGAMDLRIGNGYDVHAFTGGDHVWLCGVRVAHDKALLGHSDADVGMHALTDAIYGALAEGDIGRHFPPSDPQWKGAASHIFLDHAVKLAAARGYRIGNCDITLVCERPRIGPHALDMQAELARIMGLDPARVSVKATTSERLGFTGREEGIAAMASVVLLGA
ncbi:bifunctional 2-C-methyl-D-erythritol 4-phosphate cytidylyltransferase/2-C-methyl-D-erythritol 2,4-cyclodiphosphate synthase [Pseudogemmobacter sonorensis]|uniref:bifunctional 2-C-methyl-D-erythritol 4-phosphate cytidylyltransferase/2-C-methyl-D-erythritol 2,4-cyclodiphosphate synthase n=1 Tax=Pseudogemmobacter sonorensis TaxID=2989681 RepID=UPI0036C26D95